MVRTLKKLIFIGVVVLGLFIKAVVEVAMVKFICFLCHRKDNNDNLHI